MCATGIKVAVVTGANKGIGFGVVKLLLQRWEDSVVYATARDTERGQKAVQELEQFGNVKFHQLDIDSDESRRDFRDFILAEHGGIDVLVNNAAISYWPDSLKTLVHQVSETMRVNFFGTLALSRLLFPLLRKEARVVNVTSSLSHLSHINGREPESGELRRQLGSVDLTEKRLVGLMEEFILRFYLFYCCRLSLMLDELGLVIKFLIRPGQ